MTLTRHPLLSAALCVLIALVTVALLELLTGAVAHGGDDQVDAISGVAPVNVDSTAVATPPEAAAAPAPAPAPAVAVPASESEIVRLWRAGYLAAAVALGLHAALGFALVRWGWVVAALPPLGRWKWRAIASSVLAALTVTVPAAASGQLTWPGLVWPVIVGVALAFLPGPPPPLQQGAPA